MHAAVPQKHDSSDRGPQKWRNGREATRNKTIYELIPRYFIEIYEHVADAFAYMNARAQARRRVEQKRGRIYLFGACAARTAKARNILDKKSASKTHNHAFFPSAVYPPLSFSLPPK